MLNSDSNNNPYTKASDYLNRCLARNVADPDPVLKDRLHQALLFRFTGQKPETITNTYLRNFEVPQIVLFDILANRFPLVLKAQEIVRNLYVTEAETHQHITIIDLGIGRGLQMKALLEAIDHNTTIRSVTVIGVEIMAEALHYTSLQLQSLAQTLRLKLEFVPLQLPVESVTAELLNKSISPRSTALFINASLTLHHIQEKKDRLKLFNTLHSLSPKLFTLIEPNANTYEEDFEKRLFNAYDHFSALFAFTNSLDLKDNEKKGLKEFFSNDFFDPIAFPDSHRFERLDTSENWIKIAEEAGFKTMDLSEQTKDIFIRSIEIDKKHQAYIDFKFDRQSLLGTMAFTLKSS